jgi:hypothetical protein
MNILSITAPCSITLGHFLVMMRPIAVSRLEVGLDGVLVARGVALEFTALAQALVRLDMGAGRHFLQEDFDRFRAFDALESKDAGGF